MQGTDLSKRAATRLDSLLTDLGYTLEPLGRRDAVASYLQISHQQASNMLSGLVAWNFDDLASVCTAFGKDPGFFLDPDDGRSIPRDSAVVKSATGGESIVWRSAGGFLSSPPSPSATLKYIVTSSPSYFTPSVSPTLLVYDAADPIGGSVQCSPKAGYILEDEDGRYFPMQCVAVDGDSAHFAAPFHDHRPHESMVVSLRRTRNRQTAGAKIAGRAIAAIQGY